MVRSFLADGPTAAELQRAQSRTLAELRPRHRSAGRLRRPLRRPGREPDVRRQHRGLPRSPRAHGHAPRRRGEGRGGALARRAALHDGRPALSRSSPPATRPSIARSLPPLGDAPAVSFPAVQRTTLANGLKVILLERHATPIVNVALAVDAGYAADEPAKAGLAALALDLLDDGTTTRDTFRDRRRARRARRAHHDAQLARPLRSCGCRRCRRTSRPSLQIMADVVLNPAFPADLVALEKRRQIAQIGQEKADPTGAALRVVPRLLYGTAHAYAKPFTGIRRRVDGRVAHPRRSRCAGTGPGSRRTAAR